MWRERKPCRQAKESGYISTLTCCAASETYSWQDLQNMELQAIPTDSFTDTGKAFIPSGWGEFRLVCASSYCRDSGTGKKTNKTLTKIHTRGAFTISTIAIHNISPWYLGPCYYNMVSPRVANGGYGFQTCENIFSKQKRTTDKRWSCSLRVGQGQILTCYEMGWKAWKLYRFLERRKQRKGTWDLELEMWSVCIGQGHWRQLQENYRSINLI
jgi:hypothetical protein